MDKQPILSKLGNLINFKCGKYFEADKRTCEGVMYLIFEKNYIPWYSKIPFCDEETKNYAVYQCSGCGNQLFHNGSKG